MTYQLRQIAEILGIKNPVDPSRSISVLLTDSRSLVDPEHSLFFAITTPSGDGHRYITDLYNAGCRAFCVEHIEPQIREALPDADFLVVPSSTVALQEIARYHRRRFSIPVVGITGSRGKTTVKEWLYQLMSPDKNIVRSPRSFNSRIGVPLSIWELSDESELAIFEAGISKVGEMEPLRSLIDPTIGVLTSIAADHDDGFASIEEKIEEKASLMTGCTSVVYPADDARITDALDAVGYSGDTIGWSYSNPASPLFISSTARIGRSTLISCVIDADTRTTFTIPFTSRRDIDNAISCIAVMLALGYAPDFIASRTATLSPVGTRLEVIEGVNNCLLVYDSYTSDIHSLSPALDFMMRRTTALRSPAVILSDLSHEDLNPDLSYRRVAEILSRRGISRVIGIGEEISAHAKYFPADSCFYPSTSAFLTSASPGDFDSELILIKGAPRFNFELVAEMLEARQHETVLEVNLDNIVHNYNFYRAHLRPTTGIVCMVKAFGYGAGSYELAKTLQSQGAAYLAVAVADEGVDLRKAGITMPIMVLNPRVVNYKTLFAYNLEPEIYSFDMMDRLIREGEKYGITDYPVHIKFDTGMHRLGFLETDIPELITSLKNQSVLRPVSIFSHLAGADDPALDDYTLNQFDYFDRCYNALQPAFNHRILRHILNSTGITRFPDHQFDLVRLGICLYGIATMDDGSQADLRPVSSLYTSIISLKKWHAGTTIGYNCRGILHRDSTIATIPVGYADGIDRHFGNGNMQLFINGHRCPTVGNVCMDTMMIDVTDVDVAVGDSVEIFGPNIPVAELAQRLDTIPYEILTSISQRVKRIYFNE